MSATVCECKTVLHPHVHDRHTPQPQPGRYQWPSFSSLHASSSNASGQRRPTALRVVSSETTPPSPSQKPAAARTEPVAPGQGTVPVRVSLEHSSLEPSVITSDDDASGAVRKQGRLPAPELEPQSEGSPLPLAPKQAKALHHHVRAKSTTAVGEPSHLDSPSARTTPRARASSSATMATQTRSRPRPRLPSMLSSVLTNPRASVQTRIVSTKESDLVGSFAPTSSPRERLLSLLSPGSVAPSPAPSAPPSPCRGPLRLSMSLRHASADPASRQRRRHHSLSPADCDSPPTPLPSICRTPSSYTGSEYFPTAPSSAGPATPVHTAATLPFAAGRSKPEASALGLHPVLESLERASMFSVQTACATCGRHGSNFPCCPKCGEMWCSRACRLQKGNGKRHICASRRA
ncbi:hypothetical protein C8Q77DRAFT_1123887 [Trametes polyzona]|nr:hypothetical protein C8Q77DRAFT_1123887 [Trametes polyzona]